jgi:hypothetical protein
MLWAASLQIRARQIADYNPSSESRGRRIQGLLYRDDGPSAFVERLREVGGQTDIQGYRVFVTTLVDAVAYRPIAVEDDGVDLQDVRGHGTTFAEDVGLGH